MIVWINGTHGVGKTTTGALLLGPSEFRFAHLDLCAEAARSWLHDEAEVVDTTDLTPGEVAHEIADSLRLVP
jgi:broad-specificity NMP kinase